MWQANNIKIVYLLPDIGIPTLHAVQTGEAPRERLFGAVQLMERNYEVIICDDQWKGTLAPFRRILSRYLELPALKTCLELWNADIVVIQGRLGFLLLLFAKMRGAKVIYIDVMFAQPKKRLSKFLTGCCLKYANGIIGYSAYQLQTWSKYYRIPVAKMLSVNYPMDCNFYNKPIIEKALPPFVIAVGRDIGRDFTILVKAAISVGINVKLVTLPYLVPNLNDQTDDVEVLQRLSYPDLFSLYAKSSMAIVPLKSNISYSSGIRAVLESMLLKVPVIATYTTVLAEEFNHGEHLLFVEAGNSKDLEEAIERILNEPDLVVSMVENAWRKVKTEFKTQHFADAMEELFKRISKKSRY
jgi:glycosyltransferase involved in cell wall biosynthesis